MTVQASLFPNKDEKDYQVYIITCSNNSLYTGISKDPNERFKKHERGEGAKYFYHTKPLSIVWKSKWMTKSQALKEEYRIKQMSRDEKLVFIFH